MTCEPQAARLPGMGWLKHGLAEEWQQAGQSQQCPEMRCQDTQGYALPVGCDAERPMQDARRHVYRAAHP
jgi:hypothetical protein